MEKKIRGFEIVKDEARVSYDVFTDEKGVKHEFATEIKLPTRADKGSAGYDIYLPKDITLLPAQKTLIWTDVKAYMQEYEVLKMYIRSSLAIKQGIMLTNNVGIVDASYYGNEGNDGNMAIPLVNTSGKAVKLLAGERVAQVIFEKYLVADINETAWLGIVNQKRTGGIGSSGK